MQLPRHKPFLAVIVLLVAIVAIGTPSAFAGPPPVNAPDPAALQKKLQARFDEMHQANGFPGATLAVVTPDGKEFSLATGVSNVTSATPMRPNDRILAGSIGKTFF